MKIPKTINHCYTKLGFTLTELLVVLAIVGLLLGLLLPALSAAKKKARLIVCTSNLKQIGYANQIFADDNGHFPLWMHINSNNKGYYWFDQLQPYLNTTWTDQGVFKCPDNKLNNAAGGLSDIVNGTLPRGSYGMNTHGAKVTYFGKSMLGLGVSRNAAIEGFERTKFIPRNTDDIQSPWKFISFGDGLLSRSGHRIEGFFNIQAFAHGYVKENPKLSSLEDSIHKGRSNVSFLDLHIQPEDKSALFKNTLENRKRWHFDDKPHLELKIIIR